MRNLSWQVTLADISVGGCRCRLPNSPLVEGEGVNLIFGGKMRLRAQVSWRRGDGIGITFAKPLSDRMLARIMAGEFEEMGAQDQTMRPC